ncbi:HPP family protein [Varunaivibrio sulfuroxidans]|uniref:HPP family protein n=1 Tax=Varunaivibrio sulfuroxidans TaxID=1773489 RepID=A0A4R3JCS6_9PROT|nr:HPP family protein [Varunaivibrio sulfuroxidans]TCS63572.1 HPP family protein [Varunaivibrio sulfuroxidans]WES30285.1 HPP family protein [Varunaivibrio sulfuroxidans]
MTNDAPHTPNASPTNDPRPETPGAPLRRWGMRIGGGHAAPPGAPSLIHVARVWCGALIAIAALAFLTETTQHPLLLGSFGATCVLVFGFPDSPFSQPRNVIGGHVLSSFTGLVFISVLGVTWWSAALALATAIAVMQLTRTVHPPAGSNPVIIMLTHASWPFLLNPTLTGAVILSAIALAFHTLTRKAPYPTYW